MIVTRGKMFSQKFNDPALNMVSALYLFTIYVSSTSLLNVQLQRLTTTHNTLSLPLSTSCHLLPPPLFLTTTWHLKQCDCQGLLWTMTTTAGHITVSSFTFFIFLTYFFLLLGMYNGIMPTINVNGIHNFDCYVTK